MVFPVNLLNLEIWESQKRQNREDVLSQIYMINFSLASLSFQISIWRVWNWRWGEGAAARNPIFNQPPHCLLLKRDWAEEISRIKIPQIFWKLWWNLENTTPPKILWVQIRPVVARQNPQLSHLRNWIVSKSYRKCRHIFYLWQELLTNSPHFWRWHWNALELKVAELPSPLTPLLSFWIVKILAKPNTFWNKIF